MFGVGVGVASAFLQLFCFGGCEGVKVSPKASIWSRKAAPRDGRLKRFLQTPSTPAGMVTSSVRRSGGVFCRALRFWGKGFMESDS